LELLITKIPSHEIYIRLVVLALFIFFGVIISIFLQKQKQAEKKIHSEAAKWQTTFDAMHDAVSLLDLNGIVLQCNQSHLSLLGKKEADVSGKHCWEIVHGTNKPIDGCPFVKMKKSFKRESITLPIGNKWFNVVVDPIFDTNKNLIGAVHIIGDVTEHKLQVEKLRIKDFAFQSTLSADSIANNDGFLTHANLYFVRIWGYDNVDEVIGKPILDFLADKDKALEIIESINNTGKWEGEYTALRKDGSTFIAQSSANAVYDEEGNQTALYSSVVDVTEHKQTDEALRKSEAKLQSIFAAAPMGIGLITDRIIGWGNKRIYDMLGYPIDSLIGKKGRILYENDNEYERVGKIVYGDIKEKGIGEVETRWRRKDGSVFDCILRVTPLYVSDQSAGNLVAVIDVTERKQTEEHLRIERDNLNNIFESMVDGIYIVNPQYDIQYVNSALRKAFGSPDGIKCYKYFHDVDEPCTFCKNKEVFAGKTVRWEWTSPRNGKTYDLVDTPVKNPDGSISKLEIFRDITKRKNSEIELQLLRDRLRLFIDSSPDFCFLKDREGRYLLVNTSNAQYFGEKESFIIGKTDFDFMPEENAQRFRKSDFRAMEEKKMIIEEEIVNENVYETRKIPVIQNKNVIGVAGVIRDITESKQAEKEYKELEEQFRQAQKMEAIGVLAGGVAHDFNNILNVILGYSELLIDKLHKDDPMLHKINNIRKSAESATSLTRQLLAFSRKQILQPTVLNLNNIVKDMENMLHRLIGEDIDLESVLEENLHSVNADNGQIEQTIMNIVINARDAMPVGGKLLIETQNVEFDDEYVKNHKDATIGHHVMLAISDTGIGMTKEVQERIFEPFFTTKERGKGTGLGISTVYGIVKQSGGSIWVYSEVGKGTTFKIYFPAELTKPTPKKITITEPKIRKKPATILIVEDNKSMCAMIGEILDIEGFRAFLAYSADEAISLYKKHEQDIDMVLTDVVMPGMSGKMLVENLRKINSQLRVLFMSGYTDNAIAHHGVLDEGTHFIQKPFMVKELVKKINSTLDEPEPEVV
ncbi:MAG: PAS domain S-box protein, partial [Planctomycetes bacterium]|nr:PAS domain S-box protein [Planctomycetota bacterium]